MQMLALEVPSLSFGPLESRGTVVGRVYSVAAVLDRPDRQAVRR